MYSPAMEFMTMVPRVSVSISLRRPMRPLDGTLNSILTRPDPWLAILTISPFLGPEALDDSADEVFRDVDGEDFGGLHERAVDALGDDGGARDQELEAFAAHHFDEHGELQLAAAEHLEGVGGVGGFHADGDVGEELALEAILDVARGDELAFTPGERASCSPRS